MTTIIITIIGILLAGAAALMMTFYGGDAFFSSKAGAESNAIKNAGTNFLVAWKLAKIDYAGRIPLTATNSVDRWTQWLAVTSPTGQSYFKAPQLPSYISQYLYVAAPTVFYYLGAVPSAVCARFNADLGNGVIAAGADGTSKKMICVPDSVAANATGTVYINV